MSNDQIEIKLHIIKETPLAVYCSNGFLNEWVPKSQVEYTGSVGECCTFLMPEWLAKDKGFI